MPVMISVSACLCQKKKEMLFDGIKIAYSKRNVREKYEQITFFTIPIAVRPEPVEGQISCLRQQALKAKKMNYISCIYRIFLIQRYVILNRCKSMRFDVLIRGFPIRWKSKRRVSQGNMVSHWVLEELEALL
ncbi:MAG: hypothetical protein HZA15_16280 [Nitrospirae bacterium]|nr:hypothetical protein [Nitrospirota bacterium]